MYMDVAALETKDSWPLKCASVRSVRTVLVAMGAQAMQKLQSVARLLKVGPEAPVDQGLTKIARN